MDRSGRCGIRTAAGWIGVVSSLVLAAGVLAAEPPGQSRPPSAAEAVSATLEVERLLLGEDMDRRERLAADRVRTSTRLTELYAELDGTFRRTDAQVPRLVQELVVKLDQAERERAAVLGEERLLIERIQERFKKTRLLEERLAALEERAQEVAGPLSGRWDVVLLPSSQRGLFSLTQTGALISGTYQLDGGWSGSLQGTLVNRKVRLERIDSRLGRSAEFEGFLSSDGTQIRGSWRSYELSGDQPSNGMWSAVRQSPAR